MSSCQYSIGITKRRYKKGYHVSISQRTEVHSIRGDKVQECNQEEQTEVDDARKSSASVVTLSYKNVGISLNTELNLLRTKKLQSNTLSNAIQNTLTKFKKPHLTSVNTGRSEVSPNWDDLFTAILIFLILLLVLALVVPPLPVLLLNGELSVHFWVNLLITSMAITFAFLGLFVIAIPLWIIAVGYSWWYIFNN